MWLLHNFQNTVLYNLSGLLLLIFDSVQSDINLFAMLRVERKWLQKQAPEVFYEKFRKMHRKTPVSGSYF